MPGSTPAMGVHPWRRRLVRLTIAFSIALIVLSGLFLWGAYRYQAVVSLVHEAQASYAAINLTEPFTPPAPGPAADAARWEAVLRVRQSTLQSLTTRLRRVLERALNNPATPPRRMVVAMLILAPELRQMLDAHMAALRREKISPDEYRWRLGLAAVAALRDPNRYPAGVVYVRVLDQAAILAHTHGGPGAGLSSNSLLAGLEAHYKGYGPDDPAKLDGSDSVACALDLLLVGTQWTEGVAMPVKSPFKSLFG
jgi:hypothetical protein